MRSSGCTTMTLTAASAFGLKPVSNEPSGFRRPMRLRATPASSVKRPPTRILPVDCRAIVLTSRLAPGLNPSFAESAEASRGVSAPKTMLMTNAMINTGKDLFLLIFLLIADPTSRPGWSIQSCGSWLTLVKVSHISVMQQYDCQRNNSCLAKYSGTGL